MLQELLQDVKKYRLKYVELTTQPDNIASQKVILANGGTLVETFKTDAAYGGVMEQRYRIALE